VNAREINMTLGDVLLVPSRGLRELVVVTLTADRLDSWQRKRSIPFHSSPRDTFVRSLVICPGQRRQSGPVDRQNNAGACQSLGQVAGDNIMIVA
jgi:hypothetical protein